MIDGSRRTFQRISSFLRPTELDHDLEAEMAAQLEMAVEEKLRSGMSPAKARRQALIEFGGKQQAREQHRESRGVPVLDELLQDLRYTFRALRKDRSFAIIAVLILTLGMSANITVFSVVNRILISPLPFPKAEQLVCFTGNQGQSGLSAVNTGAAAGVPSNRTRITWLGLAPSR
jgi:hypothetical protein